MAQIMHSLLIMMNESTSLKEYFIIGISAFGLVFLIPLIAVLGLIGQFVFVAVAPIVIIGAVAYALISPKEPEANPNSQ